MTHPPLMTGLWLKIGCLSFGGPAAQIALIHRELVEERELLSEEDFLRALSFCMMLPGPEAMQLATYVGWRVTGWRGGLVAGLCFVVPGALVMLALAAAYVLWGSLPLAEALFLGVKAAVLVIVIGALLRIAQRALRARLHWAIAAAAFAALWLFAVPFPVVIACAAAVGALAARPVPNPRTQTLRPLRHAFGPVMLGLALWWAPLVMVGAWSPMLGEIGRFFAVLAVISFGGAYAVLSYLADTAVAGQGWLSAAEMADALGLAETTPGPLILVTEFVAFLAAARSTGGVDLGLGLLGALVALWATFVPCFLFVFTGAPYIERIAERPRLSAALAGITAAVIGVILNLALWFALQINFANVTRMAFGPLEIWVPDWSSLDPAMPLLTFIAAAVMFGLRLGIAGTIAVSAVLGLVVSSL